METPKNIASLQRKIYAQMTESKATSYYEIKK